MERTSRQAHWENVYTTRGEHEVSWFQENPAPSLELIAQAGAKPATAIIDIGGGASRLQPTPIRTSASGRSRVEIGLLIGRYGPRPRDGNQPWPDQRVASRARRSMSCQARWISSGHSDWNQAITASMSASDNLSRHGGMLPPSRWVPLRIVSLSAAIG